MKPIVLIACSAIVLSACTPTHNIQTNEARLINKPLALITNPVVSGQVDLPNEKEPLVIEIKQEEGKEPVLAGTGLCYTISGSAVIDTTRQAISFPGLRFTRVHDCAYPRELTLQEYAFELLQQTRFYEIGSNKIKFENANRKTILWFRDVVAPTKQTAEQH